MLENFAKGREKRKQLLDEKKKKKDLGYLQQEKEEFDKMKKNEFWIKRSKKNRERNIHANLKKKYKLFLKVMIVHHLNVKLVKKKRVVEELESSSSEDVVYKPKRATKKKVCTNWSTKTIIFDWR